MIETMFNSTQASLVQSEDKPHITQVQTNARCFQKPIQKQTQSQATVRAVLPKNISSPKKPMRPLTAYHIFFQIEREYIVQTLDGEYADKSFYKGKRYMTDVPARYQNIKLSPDWYAGPGKRKKRKHRKSHGKIGFLELSREISTRWAKLEELDSETKQFVKAIAQSELEEYHREMKEYKTSATIGTVTSKTLPERNEPLVNAVKASPLSQYQQTFRRPYHPYEEQFHSHFEQPVHFQAPAPVLSNPVFKSNDVTDNDKDPISSSPKTSGDFKYCLSCLDEEYRGEGEERASSRDVKLLSSMFDPVLKVEVMDNINSATKSVDTSDHVDIGDDAILKWWSS